MKFHIEWQSGKFQIQIWISQCSHPASLVAQTVKNLLAMQETWVQSLVWEDLLEEGPATHSSFFAWRIPWIEELGGLQSMRLQRVGHDWATEHNNVPITCYFITHSYHTFLYIYVTFSIIELWTPVAGQTMSLVVNKISLEIFSFMIPTQWGKKQLKALLKFTWPTQFKDGNLWSLILG